MNDQNAVDYLTRLYESLQVLNRKLVTASASGTLEAVHDINELLPFSSAFDPKRIPPEQLPEARELVRRILVLQELNRSACNGGLKIIRSFAESMGKLPAYDERGNLSDVSLQDLNVSA